MQRGEASFVLVGLIQVVLTTRDRGVIFYFGDSLRFYLIHSYLNFRFCFTRTSLVKLEHVGFDLSFLFFFFLLYLFISNCFPLRYFG